MSTVIVVPDWISGYFQKVVGTKKSRCNLCEEIFDADLKSSNQLEHLKTHHKVIFELHESNPEPNVGFRIEFLNFNELKEDEFKDKPIILEEMTSETENVQKITEAATVHSDEVGLQYVLIERKKKKVLQGNAGK